MNRSLSIVRKENTDTELRCYRSSRLEMFALNSVRIFVLAVRAVRRSSY
jgi:hypothetical protein